MSPNVDIIYDYPPVFDEYGDEEWYSWATGSLIIKDKVLYNRTEKIDEVDYVFRKIPKKFVLVVQLCAAAGKQPERVRSPLDYSDFWVCGSTLTEARSDRTDCRLDHSTGIFSYAKLLQFVLDSEKHTSLNNNDECKIVPFDPGVSIPFKGVGDLSPYLDDDGLSELRSIPFKGGGGDTFMGKEKRYALTLTSGFDYCMGFLLTH